MFPLRWLRLISINIPKKDESSSYYPQTRLLHIDDDDDDAAAAVVYLAYFQFLFDFLDFTLVFLINTRKLHVVNILL